MGFGLTRHASWPRVSLSFGLRFRIVAQHLELLTLGLENGLEYIVRLQSLYISTVIFRHLDYEGQGFCVT